MEGIRITYRTERPELDMIKVGYSISNGYDMYGVVADIEVVEENKKTIYIFTMDNQQEILVIR